MIIIYWGNPDHTNGYHGDLMISLLGWLIDCLFVCNRMYVTPSCTKIYCNSKEQIVISNAQHEMNKINSIQLHLTP